MPFRCPRCKTVLDAPAEPAGDLVTCRGCGQGLRLPATAGAAAAAGPASEGVASSTSEPPAPTVPPAPLETASTPPTTDGSATLETCPTATADTPHNDAPATEASRAAPAVEPTGAGRADAPPSTEPLPPLEAAVAPSETLPPIDATVAEDEEFVALEAVAAPPEPTIAVGETVEVRAVLGRPHIFWRCPMCHDIVDLPLELAQRSVRCPHCAGRIDVPPTPRRPAPTPALRIVETWSDDGDREPTRRRRPERDDDARWDSHRPRPSGTDAITGIVLGAVGLAVGFVALMCGLLIPPRFGLALFFVLPAALIAVFLGLGSAILSGMALGRSDGTNRGAAVTGLVCGLLAFAVTLTAVVTATVLGK